MTRERRIKKHLQTINSIPDGSHLTGSEYAALRRRYLEEAGPSQTDGMFAYTMWATRLNETMDRQLEQKGVTIEPPPASSAYPAKDYKAWG